jgi:aryl-alcohol dehydrogenase-like predicted oxidoreductase
MGLRCSPTARFAAGLNTRFTGDDLRNSDPKFQPQRFAQYVRAVEALDRFARDNYGKRVIELAVRWVLDRGETNVALWGARRPDQLASVGEVTGWRIDAAAMMEIDRVLRDTIADPVGPEFMAPPDQLAA